jgi:hypothetical protein
MRKSKISRNQTPKERELKSIFALCLVVNFSNTSCKRLLKFDEQGFNCIP